MSKKNQYSDEFKREAIRLQESSGKSIPAVVGTGVSTQKITTRLRIRVNGAVGLVEILG